MAQIQVFDLLAPIAQVCRGCNVTTMTDAYVRAVRELCQRSRVFQSTLLGSTTIDVPVYNLGSDAYHEVFGVRGVSVEVSPDDIRGLDDRSGSEWDQTDASDVPEFYQYIPEGQLAIHPKPNAVYPLTITLLLQPKIGSNSIDDSLVVKWSEAFIAGALAYLLRLPGVAWTDKAEAERMDTDFKSWIVKASSAAERRYRLRVRNSAY